MLTVFLVPGYVPAGVQSSGTPRNLTQQQMDKANYSLATTNKSSVEGKQSKLTPPVEANTSWSVPVATKAVLTCPSVSLTNVLIIRWEINLRDKPSCIRAYRRDNNETSERNCTDEKISWESRPDQNPALQIDPVATTHDGYYRCEVAAPDGNFGLGYHLQVLVPPEVTLSRGSNGTLVCRAAAGKPAAQISWTPGGDCHTAEQQLGNGTVTVLSTCHWEDLQVSNVSCSVSHVTGNKTLSFELNPGDQSPLKLTILSITSSILITLVIVGFIVGSILKIDCCRKCKLKKMEAPSVVEEEEMQPYASYTEKNNPLYDTVSK
ncbi:cell surface glycoprotein CD200 receptor 1 [Zalophus californianus]|uniref:Cell surface glycoprotein CD200 receptor 1 n=1 Tax=Zalophus californianus TaxID=9704 RepID=A0A6J2C8G9_ZALCA|nr:cell surface glycoprotein CD200 receptor 1 [Zalophus californianus]XP_027438903.2 cell surface glycoprotein CD200 receptor 1 [Zalophus californianus]XP_027438904.2 cell surface glycoprotein CD200 receptor 1 [Zalophus californianus]